MKTQVKIPEESLAKAREVYRTLAKFNDPLVAALPNDVSGALVVVVAIELAHRGLGEDAIRSARGLAPKSKKTN